MNDLDIVSSGAQWASNHVHEKDRETFREFVIKLVLEQGSDYVADLGWSKVFEKCFDL